MQDPALHDVRNMFPLASHLLASSLHRQTYPGMKGCKQIQQTARVNTAEPLAILYPEDTAGQGRRYVTVAMGSTRSFTKSADSTAGVAIHKRPRKRLCRGYKKNTSGPGPAAVARQGLPRSVDQQRVVQWGQRTALAAQRSQRQ